MDSPELSYAAAKWAIISQTRWNIIRSNNNIECERMIYDYSARCFRWIKEVLRMTTMRLIISPSNFRSLIVLSFDYLKLRFFLIWCFLFSAQISELNWIRELQSEQPRREKFTAHIRARLTIERFLETEFSWAAARWLRWRLEMAIDFVNFSTHETAFLLSPISKYCWSLTLSTSSRNSGGAI